ncbi:hypothetical protein [Neobacillus massiliamazoniensis]|uniref:Chitosanase n=1 Tax=Neobacillus massiliamazoniensis TaxID=1499688 RepID=A0A0U1NQF6_9BACI|nr:hypothetical protein [Neobacillus massiliamazoniensis]CRK80281.1 hypothetical protein BN000_00162 [Neobacillus massiliamazoniensis]
MKRKVYICLLLLLLFPISTSAQMLDAESLPNNLREDLLLNTGFFEGEQAYSTVAGNFDGQGISFGILQFNLGQNTLEPLLEEYIRNYPRDFETIFGEEKSQTLKQILKESHNTQRKWATTISIPGQAHKLKPDWQQAFEQMGKTKENQQIQRKYALVYIELALGISQQLGIKSTQGLAFSFDQIVNDGSFPQYKDVKKEVGARGNIDDKERLQIILRFIKKGVQYERRDLIFRGSGLYFGRDYKINNYGQLSYRNNWR